MYYSHEHWALHKLFAGSDYNTRELGDSELPTKQVSLTSVAAFCFRPASIPVCVLRAKTFIHYSGNFCAPILRHTVFCHMNFQCFMLSRLPTQLAASTAVLLPSVLLPCHLSAPLSKIIPPSHGKTLARVSRCLSMTPRIGRKYHLKRTQPKYRNKQLVMETAKNMSERFWPCHVCFLLVFSPPEISFVAFIVMWPVYFKSK